MSARSSSNRPPSETVRGLCILVLEDEPPSRARLVQALEGLDCSDRVLQAADGREALSMLRRERIDLLFADIELPGMSGFDVLAALEPAARPLVVFVTAHAQFAVDAFTVEALDFLPKPWSRERLARVVERARGLVIALAATRRPPRLVLRHGAQAVSVAVSEVVAATAARNYVRVHTRAGEHLARETLERFVERLPQGEFARVHRSTVIRLACVRRLVEEGAGAAHVVLDDGSTHVVGRARIAAVRRLLAP